jgi:hypothetical protein
MYKQVKAQENLSKMHQSPLHFLERSTPQVTYKNEKTLNSNAIKGFVKW